MSATDAYQLATYYFGLARACWDSGATDSAAFYRDLGQHYEAIARTAR